MNVWSTLYTAVSLPDSLEICTDLTSKISISLIHRDTPVFDTSS